MMENKFQKTVDNFWTRVEKTDSCWLFIRGQFILGYGHLHDSRTKTPIRAHRFSWEIHNGSIPKGMMVCHKCDIRNCVNPKHLFLGNASDNMQDMVRKRRHRNQKKSHCDNGHKLTEENIYRRPGNIEHRSCKTCKWYKDKNLSPKGTKTLKKFPKLSNKAKTHCVHGHPFTKDNTIVKYTKTSVGIGRACRTCTEERKAKYKLEGRYKYKPKAKTP